MPETPFPPGYLELLYEQISSLSAVLGGFAIASLTVLLTAAPERRVASWAAGAAGVSAGALIATTLLSAILSSDAMKRGATSFADFTPGILSLTTIQGVLFPLGIYALLLSLGLCGWIRSRRVGVATSVAAAVGALGVTAGFAATV